MVVNNLVTPKAAAKLEICTVLCHRYLKV
jgi:hypothetical protein